MKLDMVVSPPLVMVRDTVSRMHKPHPEHWQKTIVMHKKAHGQEYVSPKTGRIHRVMIPKAVIEKVHAYISQLTVTESPDSRESRLQRVGPQQKIYYDRAWYGHFKAPRQLC